MKQSDLVYTTYKEKPRDEEAKNAILLIRAGFIEKVSAGIYNLLPLGLRVVKKIENIIRDELNKIGCQELLLPALHPKENWEKTGRWEKFDDLFKVKSRTNLEYGLGPTHEEIIFPSMKKIIASYKDLPKAVYQIQIKFRDELRAKSGLLRGREFLMKDLYSFHKNVDEVEKFKKKVDKTYLKIFKRCGLNVIETLAKGGTFSPYSTEFQVETGSGEDTIYYCKKCKIAFNKELNIVSKCKKCSSNLEQVKAIEVGNTFNIGTKFSEYFDVKFRDKDGKEKIVYAGCYGIGVTRLFGSIAEVYGAENKMFFPKEVAPFDLHIIVLVPNNSKIKSLLKTIEKRLDENNIDYLVDDRSISAGEKFAESDLIGIPERIILSEKTLKEAKIELREQTPKGAQIRYVKIGDIISKINQISNIKYQK